MLSLKPPTERATIYQFEQSLSGTRWEITHYDTDIWDNLQLCILIINIARIGIKPPKPSSMITSDAPNVEALQLTFNFM